MAWKDYGLERVVLSGGFDPLHIGHLKMIKDASKHGRVIIVLNSDEWLMRKKGFVFMPYEERKEILMNINGVHGVMPVDDSDDTVCEALRRIDPNFFGNGGDRTTENTPERELCDGLGITMLWGIGGDKSQSSSELVRNAMAQLEISCLNI